MITDGLGIELLDNLSLSLGIKGRIGCRIDMPGTLEITERLDIKMPANARVCYKPCALIRGYLVNEVTK